MNRTDVHAQAATICERNDSIPNDAIPEDAIPHDAIDELPLPYVEMDVHGVVTRANRATLALYAAGHGDLVGKLAWEFMPGDEREKTRAEYMALMQSGEEPFKVRRTIFDRSGKFRIYEMHRNLIRDAEGRPCGMRTVGLDVTEARHKLEESRRTGRWLESALESLAEGVALTDALGFIRFVNPALEKLLGWSASELLGKVVEKAIPIVCFQPQCPDQLCFSLALQERSKGDARVLNREGREVRVEITTTPIVDNESGSTSGVAAILRRLE
jgi:PAS domain S-box-containing protein